MTHPLDRPVWTALSGRQAEFATGDARAWRFRPAVNMLGAAADASPEALAALAALVPTGGLLGTVEAEEQPVPPGLEVRKRAMLAQMVLEADCAEAALDWVPLGEGDAPAMLALATLTEPGPFHAETHRLGAFVGVKIGGRLVAMAGERMRAPGFTEVSAVCTHPDFRGKGHAGGLMRVVIGRILARGERAFLHSYASNAGAIALYESLGFRVRADVVFTVLGRS